MRVGQRLAVEPSRRCVRCSSSGGTGTRHARDIVQIVRCAGRARRSRSRRCRSGTHGSRVQTPRPGTPRSPYEDLRAAGDSLSAHERLALRRRTRPSPLPRVHVARRTTRTITWPHLDLHAVATTSACRVPCCSGDNAVVVVDAQLACRIALPVIEQPCSRSGREPVCRCVSEYRVRGAEHANGGNLRPATRCRSPSSARRGRGPW